MKLESLKPFSLGVAAMLVLHLLVAATPVAQTSVPTVITPATPIHTVCYQGYEPSVFVVKWAKQGYIVVTASVNPNYSQAFIVMAKY